MNTDTLAQGADSSMKAYSRALTIAGSDSGGGAGIQADLKTFHACGVYGLSVLTALTAQNTLGVHGIHDVPPDFITAQLDAVLSDIGCDAAKTGMLSRPEAVEAVAAAIRKYQVQRLVVDPVMVAKGGSRLLQEAAVKALVESLLPLALVATPNAPEAGLLAGMRGRQLEGYEERGKENRRTRAAVGHGQGRACGFGPLYCPRCSLRPRIGRDHGP